MDAKYEFSVEKFEEALPATVYGMEKWHHIPQGREMTKSEQEYVMNVIMEWIERQMKP